MPPFHGHMRKRAEPAGGNDGTVWRLVAILMVAGRTYGSVISPSQTASSQASSQSASQSVLTSSSLLNPASLFLSTTATSTQPLTTSVPSSLVPSSSSSVLSQPPSPKRAAFPGPRPSTSSSSSTSPTTSSQTPPYQFSSISSSLPTASQATTTPNTPAPTSSASSSTQSTASQTGSSNASTGPSPSTRPDTVSNGGPNSPAPSTPLSSIGTSGSTSDSPSIATHTSPVNISSPRPTTAADDHEPSNPVVVSIPHTSVITGITVSSESGSMFTSAFTSTSIFYVPTTVPTVTDRQASSTSNGKKTAIIAGVVGGLGGLILLVMLGFFLCVRWRRRQHATPLNWESVRTSALFSSASGPRTPKSFRSARTETPGPLSPPMSQMSHITSQSQYATAPTSATSPTRNGLGTARTNISPLLMVQTPSRSEESYHGHDEEYDPFADPLAMARLRPQLADMSPTIRVSDTTLVDQAWAGKGLPSKMGGSVDGLAAKTIHEDHDELLMAPPSLNPMAGRTNRLSNDSLPPLPQEDSSNAGFAM